MTNKLKSKPHIVLREEFDDWAILFDPDTGKTCGISPTGAFIWKQLNGSRTKDDILQIMFTSYGDNLPKEATNDYDEFIKQLLDNNLVTI